MRSSRAVWAAGAAVLVASSTVAVAGALISSTTPVVIQLTVPPSSVVLNALQDPTSVVTFDERQGVTLPAPVAVDFTNPNTYTTFPSNGGTLAAGTSVDSHLIHSDPPPANYTPTRSGSVTFADDILGVVASTTKLAHSDTLGTPGTAYAGTTRLRGLESNQDKLTISSDRRTVSFETRVSGALDEIRVITQHTGRLVTTISDTPDPVTAGNDVQYTLTVTNQGADPVADTHVIDTLPTGTTLVTASASGGCTGTGPVDCSLGSLAVNASAVAHVVVASPAAVPVGGTITNSAVASPGVSATASETTTVEAPQPGVAEGFVLPGGSITIPGDNPATITLPNTGDGAPVEISQGDGNFCGGPCTGPATTISDFGGYTDPAHPIHLTLTFSFPDSPTSLTEAATAFGAAIYENNDPFDPTNGTVVPACATAGSGVAAPHPCVDGRTIVQTTYNSFFVAFEIVYLSGDPRFARR